MSESDEGEALHAYWSIYTDFRGRQQFRKFYWDRLKDIIGRPAKLSRIERELWLGNHAELRCHVGTDFRATTRNAALTDILRRSGALAQPWQVSTHDLGEGTAREDLFEICWYRG